MKITKNRLKKIIAEEISRFEEAEQPLQKIAKDIEKKGTEGDFSEWCGKDGVTQACIDRAAKMGGKRAKQASLAVTFSKAKGGGPSLTYPTKEELMKEGTTAFDLDKQISTALDLIDAEAIKVDKEPPNLAAAARILYDVLETLRSDDPKLNRATPKPDSGIEHWRPIMKEGATNEEWEMVDAMIQAMGHENALESVIRALSSDTVKKVVKYLARMHEFPLDVEEPKYDAWTDVTGEEDLDETNKK